MKTLLQIVEGIQARNKKEAAELLKNYVDQIIDECAGSAEYTIEYEHNIDGSVNTESGYPVLMRGSILKVKELIK